jgi:putative transposase
MARIPRAAVGDVIYHVINRANGREQIFQSKEDYQDFEKLLLEAKEKYLMRILAFCIMPNHWHFVLHPENENDMPMFMRWITHTHTQRHHVKNRAIGYGHVYQGRYKSFPIEKDNHFLQVCRYVERNPLRANLVEKAQNWRWSSVWIREWGNNEQKKLLSDWPVEMPSGYLEWVNTPDMDKEDNLEKIRYSIQRSRPFGKSDWMNEIAEKLGLNSTLRSRGGQRKRNEGT